MAGSSPAMTMTDENRPDRAPREGGPAVRAAFASDAARLWSGRLRGDAVVRDRLDVPEVGAAAAAEHGHVRIALQQVGILLAELQRIARIELGRGVEFRMAAAGGIGADALDALHPGGILLQDGAE